MGVEGIHLILRITDFSEKRCGMNSPFLESQLVCTDAISHSKITSCGSYSSCFQRCRGKTGPSVCRLANEEQIEAYTPPLTSILLTEGLCMFVSWLNSKDFKCSFLES